MDLTRHRWLLPVLLILAVALAAVALPKALAAHAEKRQTRQARQTLLAELRGFQAALGSGLNHHQFAKLRLNLNQTLGRTRPHLHFAADQNFQVAEQLLRLDMLAIATDHCWQRQYLFTAEDHSMIAVIAPQFPLEPRVDYQADRFTRQGLDQLATALDGLIQTLE